MAISVTKCHILICFEKLERCQTQQTKFEINIWNGLWTTRIEKVLTEKEHKKRTKVLHFADVVAIYRRRRRHPHSCHCQNKSMVMLHIYQATKLYQSSLTIGHKKMCVNTFVMMVPCIIFWPFLKKGFPVVTSYLWWFGGKSIGYTLPAKHFCDVQGISFRPMGSVVPALFTWINLLGSRTILWYWSTSPSFLPFSSSPL